MTPSPLTPHIDAAKQAITYARDVRSYHRRSSKRGSQQRETDIEIAQKRIATAMRPLRSFLARAPYQKQTQTLQREVERVRKASATLQSERRKLWKMSTRRANVAEKAAEAV